MTYVKYCLAKATVCEVRLMDSNSLRYV